MSDGADQRPVAKDLALIEARLGIEVAADPPGRRARRSRMRGHSRPKAVQNADEIVSPMAFRYIEWDGYKR